MKKISFILCLVILINLFTGCSSQNYTIREEIKGELKLYLTLLEEARVSNSFTTDDLDPLFSINERYSDLTNDETKAINSVVGLGKSYLLWEGYTIITPNKSESAKHLKKFDSDFKKILKYIE